MTTAITWRGTSLLLILAMLAPPPAVFATDWGLEGYSYRKEITISHTNVDSNLTDFPLLVEIAADTGIGAHARSDGHDLRFTSATGSLLAYERESFESGSGSGSGIFWVKVPTISSSADTTIYLYYGKSDASDGQSAANVWDANFAGVWHLPDGSTLDALDSTANNNDGTVSGPDATMCTIDGGASFNGSASPQDFIDNLGTATGSLNITGDDLTVSAWAWWDGTDAHGWIISKMKTGLDDGSWALYIRDNLPKMGINSDSNTY